MTSRFQWLNTKIFFIEGIETKIYINLNFDKTTELLNNCFVVPLLKYYSDYTLVNKQLEAVKQDGESIRFIENPREDVQVAAVKQNVFAIKYIENPSVTVQLEIVNFFKNDKNDNSVSLLVDRIIYFIKNPIEELQLASVSRNGYSIKHIKNPSEDVQLAAVKSIIKSPGLQYFNKGILNLIKNPTEKTQIKVVKYNETDIQYIENPSETVQLEAIKKSLGKIKTKMEQQYTSDYSTGSILRLIKNPTEQTKIQAVQLDGLSIQCIEDPSEIVQVEAIKQNSNAIKFIKNPTKKVTEEIKLKVINYQINPKKTKYKNILTR